MDESELSSAHHSLQTTLDFRDLFKITGFSFADVKI